MLFSLCLNSIAASAESSLKNKIMGKWVRQDCSFIASYGRDGTYTENFQPGKIVYVTYLYVTHPETKRCSKRSFDYEATYNYTLNNSTVIEGAAEIDLQLVEVRVTPRSKGAASGMSKIKYLNFEKWKNDVAVKFTKFGGKNFPDVLQYSIIQYSDEPEKLTWGDPSTGEGTTPDNRPTKLDPRNFELRSD